jgi:hypothetical protein
MLQLVLCCGVWTLILVLVSWRFIKISQKAFNHLQRLHQVPCSNCVFFTGDYRLKCTVKPLIAMSEDAIGCRDFIVKSDPTPNAYVVYTFSKKCPNKSSNKKTFASKN